MRSKFTPFYIFLSVIFLWLSFTGGQSGNYVGHPADGGNGRTCFQCHNSGGGNGNVVLSNVPDPIVKFIDKNKLTLCNFVLWDEIQNTSKT